MKKSLLSVLAFLFLILPIFVSAAMPEPYVEAYITVPYDDPNATGMALYCTQTSGVYGNAFDLGWPDKDANGNYVIMLRNQIQTDGKTYCALTAYNDTEESQKSEEVSFFMQAGVPRLKQPPAIPHPSLQKIMP